jgi:hypothetical protein
LLFIKIGKVIPDCLPVKFEVLLIHGLTRGQVQRQAQNCRCQFASQNGKWFHLKRTDGRKDSSAVVLFCGSAVRILQGDGEINQTIAELYLQTRQSLV